MQKAGRIILLAFTGSRGVVPGNGISLPSPSRDDGYLIHGRVLRTVKEEKDPICT